MKEGRDGKTRSSPSFNVQFGHNLQLHLSSNQCVLNKRLSARRTAVPPSSAAFSTFSPVQSDLRLSPPLTAMEREEKFLVRNTKWEKKFSLHVCHRSTLSVYIYLSIYLEFFFVIIHSIIIQFLSDDIHCIALTCFTFYVQVSNDDKSISIN